MTAASESAQDDLQQLAEQADQSDVDQYGPFLTDCAGSISQPTRGPLPGITTTEAAAFYRALHTGETA